MIEKKGSGNHSSGYAPGEKFIELAELDEEVFRKHVGEYRKQVFAEDKIRILEQALEYATRAIDLYKKAIKVREDREGVYRELKAIFDYSTNQRFKVIMFLTATDKPQSLSSISRAVFGDEKRVSTVADVVRVLERLGVVKVENGDKGKSIRMDTSFREIIFRLFKADFLKALEEVCGSADDSA